MIKAFTTLLAAASIFVFSAVAVAQDASPTDIVFPITDLGGCTDLASCTTYCDDPVNYTSCANYAREKGFYQSDPTLSADTEFWTQTQSQLGCNSAESCFAFCSQAENHAACDSFAKANSITAGYVDSPNNPEYL